jgi:hypothetical protein
MEDPDTYHRYFKFRWSSTLHRQLQLRFPQIITAQRIYVLHQILWLINQIILTDQLYDKENPYVIVCDAFLDTALNVHALHTTQLKEMVLRQMMDTGTSQTQIQKDNTPKMEYRYFDGQNNTRATIPTWANMKAKAIEYRLNIDPHHNDEDLYRLDQDFYEEMIKVPQNERKFVYKYNDILWMFYRYIHHNKNTIVDNRNVKVLTIKNTPLKNIWGTDTIASCQVHYFIQSVIKPLNRNKYVYRYEPQIKLGNSVAPIMPDTLTTI